MPDGLIYLYRTVFAYLLLPPSLLPRYVFFWMCVYSPASVRFASLVGSVSYEYHRERERERVFDGQVSGKCSHPCACPLLHVRVKSEAGSSHIPSVKGGFACTYTAVHYSVNCNFTFVATPRCVNGSWDADGYLTSHRDSCGEACIVMGDVLLGRSLYLLIPTWMDVCERAEKWVAFSAEDSTEPRGGGVSTWSEEEEKKKNNSDFAMEYSTRVLGNVVFAW